MNAGLWSSLYVWFWISEKFFEDSRALILVMFVNEEVCEIVLIRSSSTEYEFSTATFIKFWCEVFTIFMGYLRI